MSDLDVLILAIYLTCVTYVFYQAIDSLEDQTTIRFDDAVVQKQLEQQGLADTVNIRFGLQSYYRFEPLQNLTIVIQNRAEDVPLYVDWDHSSISDFRGRSRRVIRLPPGMMMDLSQAQVFSVIGPGQTLSERITAEDTLRRNPDSIVIEQAAPLINLSAAKNLPEEERLFFALRLVLHRVSLGGSLDALNHYAVQCSFTVQRVPWSRRVPLFQFLRGLSQLPLRIALILVAALVGLVALLILY
jgi:hypothetical protein